MSNHCTGGDVTWVVDIFAWKIVVSNLKQNNIVEVVEANTLKQYRVPHEQTDLVVGKRFFDLVVKMTWILIYLQLLLTSSTSN